MSFLRVTTRMRPSLWPRLVLVLALVAMNFLVGTNSAMAGLANVPATVDAQGHASAKHHDQHATHHGEATIAARAARGDAQPDCPSHRDGTANGANCCAVGCLMLGLPVDLPPSFASDAGAVFLLPLPQFVASATSAHLRPPRA